MIDEEVVRKIVREEITAHKETFYRLSKHIEISGARELKELIENKRYAAIEINHLLDRLENIIEKDGRFGMIIGYVTGREVITHFIKEERERCKNG